MSRFDLLRRTAAVLAVVMCLMAIAGVASAKFTATQSASFEVGTAKLATPTKVSGTYQCRSSAAIYEGITFNISSFTDNGTPGASYLFVVTKNNSTKLEGSESSPTRSGSVSTRMSFVDGGRTTWTLSVSSVMSSWTSPVPWTTEIVCPTWGSGSGSFS